MHKDKMASFNFPDFTPEIIHHVFGPEFASSFLRDQEKVITLNREMAAAVNSEDAAINKDTNHAEIVSVGAESKLGEKSQKNQTPAIRPRNFNLQQDQIPSSAKSSENKSKATAEHKKPVYVSPNQLLFLQLRGKLQSILTSDPSIATHEHVEGRLGPQIVKFDYPSSSGSFSTTTDRLGINSQSNFASIRANVCVFQGKWQYEVQLSTCGVMQIGWSQLNTKFTSEKGVGDSEDSYGYDGNRLRKWNFGSSPFGTEVWKGGDIIGCCIDLDNAKIDFFRNGVSVGTAFQNIQRGPGIAYFPSASLTYNESITANFGASPFLFPITNYEAIQSSSVFEDRKTVLLLSWIEKILQIYPIAESEKNTTPFYDFEAIILITNSLFAHLESNVHSAFVIEHTLLPFLAKQLGLPTDISHYDERTVQPGPKNKFHLVLDLMWSYFESGLLKNILERFAIILMSYVKSNTFSFSYPYQVYSIQLLTALMEHRKTRRHFIHHLLFDKTKITNFLYVRPIDEGVLKTIISTPWWPGKTTDDAPEAKAYEHGCKVVQEKISHLENLQLDLLKVLMTNTDGTEKRPSSRSVFLRMFRVYLYDTVRPGSIVVHPVSKPMCTFFRILKTVSILWHNETSQTGASQLPDLPPTIFYDTSLEYFDLERVGGLANYLYKTFHVEVSSALGIPEYYTPKETPRSRQHRFPFQFEEPESTVTSIDDTSDDNDSGTTHEETPFPSMFGLLPLLPHFQIITNHGNSQSAPGLHIVVETSPNVPEENETAHENRATATTDLSTVLRISPVQSLTNIRAVTLPSGEIGPPHNTDVNSRAALPNQQNETTQVAVPTNFVGLLPRLMLPESGGSSNEPTVSSRTTDDITTENQSGADVEAVSDTSSAASFDESRRTQNPFGAGSLVGETASGHNMVIPMFGHFGELPNAFGRELAFTMFPNIFGFSMGRQIRPPNPHESEISRKKGSMEVKTSLRELLEDTIFIYSISVSHHVDKVVALRASIEEYITALSEAKKALASSQLSTVQRTEINKSIEIFTTKLNEQSRHMAWLKSAVFTTERQELVLSLLRTILKTLKESSALGALFRFTPDIYITVLLQLTSFLRTQMHPTVSYERIPGFRDLFRDVAEFVSQHFNDDRIVLSDTKEALTSALFKFVSDRTMLTGLEEMSVSSQISMMKSLLKPYENRAWSRSNWMLVRIWQGTGFGFQYLNCSSARKSFKTKIGLQDDYSVNNDDEPPNPSSIFQQHLKRILLENQELATNFIHSVLNQLNWAFSEFVGQLQEIASAATQLEHVYFDSRQIRVCCTCFHLTQSLLRAIEMIVSLAGPVLTDFNRENAQSLLERLCMFLSQILNRVACNSGIFGQVLSLDMQGLEPITHYSMLAAVSGILIALVHDELKITDKAKLPVTRAILLEPSMQVSSLDFLIGNTPAQLKEQNSFSLRNYVPQDISAVEIRKLEATISHLKSWSPKFMGDTVSISDDDICTICYAYPKSATFQPCHHRTCRACIIHHLLNHGECFFCKGAIEKVVADDGTILHDVQNPKGSNPAATQATHDFQ